MPEFLLAAAIALEVVATLSLRTYSNSKLKRWLVPVVAGYAGAFYFLLLVLRLGMPIAVAYGIWTASGIASVALLARLIWKEPLNWIMCIGIVVIGAGVVLVELG